MAQALQEDTGSREVRDIFKTSKKNVGKLMVSGIDEIVSPTAVSLMKTASKSGYYTTLVYSMY